MIATTMKAAARAASPWIALLCVVGLSRGAAAQADIHDRLGGDSPRSLMFELKFGPYQPNIDSEFDGSGGPYHDLFGGDDLLLSTLQVEYEFYQTWGCLAAGVGIGYSGASGKGLMSGGTKATEATSLHLIPMNASLSYHLDIFATRWSVPLVPYVRVGFDYVLWWTTDGLGDVSDWAADEDSSTRPGYGGVWGWHVGGGLKLLLDIIAPTMARTFDIELGVNNTYLFGEVLYLSADDFGSGDSLRLGDLTFAFGIAFEI